jgi:hypothetical protein
MARTIIVKGDPIHKETDAAEALMPGHLISFDTDGKGIKHATAGAKTAPAFVVERSWIGEDTETTIAIGERVEYVVGRNGDEFFARISGDPTAIAPGALLTSAGDGTLRAATGTEEGIARMIPQHDPALSVGVFRKVEIL